jgi:hypothetical protein
MDELEEARDKVRWGRERRSMAMSEEEKTGTAWHEAGHAVVNVVLKHTHPLHKVTIIPRGQALGATMYLPKEDIHNRRFKELNDLIAVTMAGRIAEQMFTDDISSGASGDIQQATSMAKAMVMHWGMSDQLGMVLYGESQEYVFLGRDMMRSKEYSESTAQRTQSSSGSMRVALNNSSRAALIRTKPKPCRSRCLRKAGRMSFGSMPTTKRNCPQAQALAGMALTGVSGLPVLKASTSNDDQPNTRSAGLKPRENVGERGGIHLRVQGRLAARIRFRGCGDGCSAVCSLELGASCVAVAGGADRCTPASPLAQAAAAVAASLAWVAGPAVGGGGGGHHGGVGAMSAMSSVHPGLYAALLPRKASLQSPAQAERPSPSASTSTPSSTAPSQSSSRPLQSSGAPG